MCNSYVNSINTFIAIQSSTLHIFIPYKDVLVTESYTAVYCHKSQSLLVHPQNKMSQTGNGLSTFKSAFYVCIDAFQQNAGALPLLGTLDLVASKCMDLPTGCY